ncbi:MAG: hypothetical protein GX439_10535 [Bacteroidales bacterium]|nr:hypothetical protein [Bacteroidales bacterium]
MGSPGAKLPRGTTRPACGVAQTVPLGHSRATFRPRPICGSGFYAIYLYQLRSTIPAFPCTAENTFPKLGLKTWRKLKGKG